MTEKKKKREREREKGVEIRRATFFFFVRPVQTLDIGPLYSSTPMKYLAYRLKYQN